MENILNTLATFVTSFGKEILVALATLVAAFVGALFAYLYNIRQKKTEIDNNNIEAGRKAIFTMCLQVNKLANYKKEHFDAHASDECSL